MDRATVNTSQAGLFTGPRSHYIQFVRDWHQSIHEAESTSCGSFKFPVVFHKSSYKIFRPEKKLISVPGNVLATIYYLHGFGAG